LRRCIDRPWIELWRWAISHSSFVAGQLDSNRQYCK
jgi:hypothetical protein